MKVILETCYTHWIRYLWFYFNFIHDLDMFTNNK